MNPIKRVALDWAHASAKGVRIHIPFDINDAEFGDNHFRFAKGTLDEIVAHVEANCPWDDPAAINDWMRGGNPDGERVGIDCSGFVYRVLDTAAIASGAPGLEATLGRTAYYTDTGMLTDTDDPSVATPLFQAQSLKTGDVMRFNDGGHVGVIIDVLTNADGIVTEVWYAHSGLSGGPHIGWIEVSSAWADIGDASTRWHDASELDWLKDDLMRDRYYERMVRPHYYLGPRDRTVKSPIAVKINGTGLSTALPSFVRDGASFAQVRPLAYAIGATIAWQPATQTAVLRRQGRELRLQVANARAQTGDGNLNLPAPPELVLGSMVAPVRSLSAGLGVQVQWQPSPPTVHITV